ncbi:MAG: hypothetical protein RXR06_11155 [Thermoproteus sp.]
MSLYAQAPYLPTYREARPDAPRTDAATAEIRDEIGALPQPAQCLQGQECALESTRALLQQLQQMCPTEVDGDVAVARRPAPSVRER